MTNKQFVMWLTDYLKTAKDTEDNVLISTMLSTVDSHIQTNPYWSNVSTTLTDQAQLNYTVVVDPKTNTYSVTNYKENEDREV